MKKTQLNKKYITCIRLFIINMTAVIIFELSPDMITYMMNLIIIFIITLMIPEKHLC